MEVKIETKRDEFIPYRVIFEINSEKEAALFHDNVAIKICQGPSAFIGDIYKSSRGRKLKNKKYTMNVKA